MFEYIKVVRAEFKTRCGTSSQLFAVRHGNHVRECIDEYVKNTGDEFLGLSETCAMTPTLFTPKEI